MSESPEELSDKPSRNSGNAGAYLLFCLAATLSAGGGWLVLQRFDHTFQPTQKMTQLYSITQRNPAEADELRLLERTLACQNTGLVLGLTGMLFAALLGISQGLLERSFPVCVFGFVAGTLLGGLGGAGGGCLSAFVDDGFQNSGLDEMLRNMLTHTSSWVVIAAATGLAILIATRRSSWIQSFQIVLAAMAAAVISGTIYAPVAAVVFADEESGAALPQGDLNQLAWLLSSMLVISIVLARTRPRRAE